MMSCRAAWTWNSWGRLNQTTGSFGESGNSSRRNKAYDVKSLAEPPLEASPCVTQVAEVAQEADPPAIDRKYMRIPSIRTPPTIHIGIWSLALVVYGFLYMGFSIQGCLYKVDLYKGIVYTGGFLRGFYTQGSFYYAVCLYRGFNDIILAKLSNTI